MESTTAKNTKARLEGTLPMTRFSIEDDEDYDVPTYNKRPRLSASTSQSHPRVITQENNNNNNDNDNDEIPIEEVESESDGSEDEEEMGTDEDEEEEDEEDEELVGRDVSSGTKVFNDVIGELKVVLTDPDVLDCPICLEPLTTPVFQCENGHIACSSCCSKVKRKCPSCCMPIGYNRCRAIEKVIEAVKVSCKNAQYGCKTTTTYSKKSEHEQLCPFVTCFCPFPSCPFAGTSNKMYYHFGSQHAVSTTRFTYNTTFFVNVATHQKHKFLQEQHESVIFILNHEVKEHGRTLSVDCVGPSTLKSCFEYEITARRLESTLSLQSVPDIYTRWTEHSLKKNYLTVPSDFFGCSGTMPLRLCIKKVVTPA